ncbi:MAG: protein-glutamate O-methyltransferase CheR [Candidatus Omnitrophica bacterium]|nr:protein-glutamate O-methyltransferase CheR [Candidatus Omnitrophota bacterium]MCA9424612.1 protein-glutamate O-methyltransferase CheR [Candidatus Omnitrophota bacterium]MCA9429842.1 protein-glutamate O-methyltransferase CheR [Candidatus Omnitrophota bacterium]MCA9439496.1 protein-glutamate O-methyltransferase CheR [Candidatus Omnitrophota bacterium]MCB9769734.1 protein-glutamate O-methyltransferase CheR [Candidatus Omnitrophota bacterium]
MLKPEERFFAELVTKESGIILGEDKSYLLTARLNPLARARGFTGLKEFYEAVKFKVDANLKRELVEALTTNETLFFRDMTPFRILQSDLIPKLKSSPVRPIRIWCAASSTGQEPYSIVMSFLEKWPDLTPRDLSVLCTDIDNTARKKGESGVYSQIEINRGLPAMMLAKYFRQEGTQWILSEKIRSFTTWKHINLTQPFVVPGPFDIVFIRNVLIYFEVTVKKQILERIATMMKPDGVLFLGSSETSMGITEAIHSRPAAGGGSYFVRAGVSVAK